MHVTILGGETGWHVRDLQRAARELAWTTSIIDFEQLHAGLPHRANDLLAVNSNAVIVRTMPMGSLEQVIFRMDCLQALEARGVPILNPPRALETCIDKYLALVRLQQAGLRVPTTHVCQQAEQAQTLFDELGRDVVVKPLFGSEGRGMIRVTDADIAWRTFRAIERTEGVLYLQQFIKHPGYDVRVFVVNGQVLAAMRRHGRGHWRTNIAQGGVAEPCQPTPEMAELAVRAATAVGTWAAGVDLLSGPNGEWYAIEVNAVPGWKAIAAATGVDVAKALLLMLEQRRTLPTLSNERALFLACLWEATAKKAGNVHPLARFADISYQDFVLSASAIAPVLARASTQPLGQTILQAVQATRKWVNSNTNLGIILLLAPLAKVPESVDLRIGVQDVLAQTTTTDAAQVYEAIRLAVPGGLGKADAQDVHDTPTQTLREVMRLAAERDMIARQYDTGFADIVDVGLPALREGMRTLGSLERAIQHTQLVFLATYPDSLIARKLGAAMAEDTAQRAQSVLNCGGLATQAGRNAYDELDGWLRDDGHRRNPGTTADLITATLYVALRYRLLDPNQTI